MQQSKIVVPIEPQLAASSFSVMQKMKDSELC